MRVLKVAVENDITTVNLDKIKALHAFEYRNDNRYCNCSHTAFDADQITETLFDNRSYIINWCSHNRGKIARYLTAVENKNIEQERILGFDVTEED